MKNFFKRKKEDILINIVISGILAPVLTSLFWHTLHFLSSKIADFSSQIINLL